ncbi:hypothetical protein [Actinacidiphila glaucinigra]
MTVSFPLLDSAGQCSGPRLSQLLAAALDERPITDIMQWLA